MTEITHKSIGGRERDREMEKEEKKQVIDAIVERFVALPNGYRLDQYAVWYVCFLAATCAFLFCAVSVVRLALR